MTKFCTTNSFFDSKEQTLSNNSSAGSIWNFSRSVKSALIEPLYPSNGQLDVA
jgi:hypothetical protein